MPAKALALRQHLRLHVQATKLQQLYATLTDFLNWQN